VDRGDFYREPYDLRFSTHPVKWLRMKLLIERAKGAGFAEVARDAEGEWKTVATTMAVSEDYHGFYDKSRYFVSWYDISRSCQAIRLIPGARKR
jgi:hypothetical protein